MLKIYLIRHAKSAGEAGVYSGSRINPGISDEGKNQTIKLVTRFKNINLKKIYSSDLNRARDTAKFLGDKKKIPIIEDKNLRELDIGDWSGTKDALKRWLDFYSKQLLEGISREDIRPPNGENTFDHAKRVKSFIDSLIKEEGEIVVIAHSGTNKVFLGIINNEDPDNFYKIKQENTCVNEIIYDKKNWKVISVNDTSHLK